VDAAKLLRILNLVRIEDRAGEISHMQRFGVKAV